MKKTYDSTVARIAALADAISEAKAANAKRLSELRATPHPERP